METPSTTETFVYDPSSVKDRQEMAMEMRLRGVSPARIATALHYDDEKDVLKDLDKRFAYESTFLTSQGRESLLALQIARLEQMLGFTWPAMEEGDPASINAGLKIIQEISKHADLYTPDTQGGQNTVLVIGGKEADYVAKLKELVESG
jgi:hypothetical protein